MELEFSLFAKINYQKKLNEAILNFANKNKKECEKKLENIMNNFNNLIMNSYLLYTQSEIISDRLKIESRLQYIFKDIIQFKGLKILSCEYKIKEQHVPIKTTKIEIDIIKDPEKGLINIKDPYENIFKSMHKHKQTI